VLPATAAIFLRAPVVKGKENADRVCSNGDLVLSFKKLMEAIGDLAKR
jgi:hypothetical protein